MGVGRYSDSEHGGEEMVYVQTGPLCEADHLFPALPVASFPSLRANDDPSPASGVCTDIYIHLGASSLHS